MEKYLIILSNLQNLRTDNSYKNLVDRIQSHQSRKVYHALPPHVLIFDFTGSSVEAFDDLKSCVDQTDHALFMQIDSSFLEKGADAEKVKLLKDFFRVDLVDANTHSPAKEKAEEIHAQAKSAVPLTADLMRAGQKDNLGGKNV
jgi:hypothetical protein